MISEKAWSYGIEALAARYARDIPEVLNAIYLEQLGHMNDAQWVASVKRVIRTLPHFPTIEELSDAYPTTRPSRLEGALMFDRVLSCKYTAESGSEVRSTTHIRKELGDAAADAFDAIGGQGRLHNMSVGDAHFARREFAEYYSDARQFHNVRAQLKGINTNPAIGYLTSPATQIDYE